jgi:general secretion pathway protein L
MSLDATQPARKGLFAAIRSAAAWCGEQIALALPPGLHAALESGVSVVTIDLEENDVVLRRFAHGESSEIRRLPRAQFDARTLSAAMAPFQRGARLLGNSFALRLPASAALARRLSLPLGARRNIRTLLDFELDRQSPIDKSEVYHDYRVLNVDRSANRMDVEWRIVRRASVSPAVEICRKAGVDLAVIAFVGDSEPSDGGNLPVDTAAARSLWMKRHLVSGLLALILVLALAVTGGFYWRNEQASAALFVQVDQARLAARESLRLEHDIAAMQRHARQLREEKLRPTASRAIAEVTRILPDGTWATEFAFRNGEVQIHGYSNAASSLIALFDASPLFTSAEFRAPLTQAASPGLQQFDLAAKIRVGAQ